MGQGESNKSQKQARQRFSTSEVPPAARGMI